LLVIENLGTLIHTVLCKEVHPFEEYFIML
jgi:hypothetical protein